MTQQSAIDDSIPEVFDLGAEGQIWEQGLQPAIDDCL